MSEGWTSGGLKAHPLADLFPMIEDAGARERLMDDIEETGMLEPIVLLDGMILDGRNRYRAAVDIGLFDGEGDDGDPFATQWFKPFGFQLNGWTAELTPRAWVLAKNLHRRHLTEGQRALVAAKLANMRQGERTDRLAEPSANLQIEEPKLSQAQAADLLNVSARSVSSAAHVLDMAAPETVAALEQGKIAASTAEQIAELPAAQQQEIVASGDKKAIREAVKAALPKEEPKEAPLSPNTYVRDLNSDTRKQEYRRTPEGQKLVPEIVMPGTLVKSSYGGGAYIVVRVSGPHSYAPDAAPALRGLPTDEYETFQHYSLVMVNQSEFEAKPQRASLKGDSYINEVVAVDGRLLKLFEANSDETFIIGLHDEAAVLLTQIATEEALRSAKPAPAAALPVEPIEPPRPAHATRVMTPQGKPYVTFAAVVLELADLGKSLTPQQIFHLARELEFIDDRRGSTVHFSQHMRDVNVETQNLVDAVSALAMGNADQADAGRRLTVVTENSVEDGAKVSADLAPDASDLNEAERQRAVYDALIADLGDGKGKLTQKTCAPYLQAGYAANVPFAQMLQDLGHPKGTVSSWAVRLGLSSSDRLFKSGTP